MALKTTQAAKTYLSIREGKVAKKQGEEWVLFNSLEGFLKEISTRETKYGTELQLTIEDDELYVFSVRIKGDDPKMKQSNYFISFAHIAPNIDVNQKIEFIPSLKIEDDKKRSALYIRQNGNFLKWAYKKGDGMPEPESLTNKKGEVISVDWSEVETFRMDKVNELSARLKGAIPVNLMDKEESGLNPFSESMNDGDDLPF
jgi:hypothetical protein